VLEASELVKTGLTNPRREEFTGWDDAANRNRLLAAAKELGPSWIMSLDADELMAPDDAAALRSFALDEADPELAYTFRVYRMVEDMEHYDDDPLWVGRLFSPRPDHVFSSDRLHFVPIPTAIPRECWRPTTIRIQHRAAITAARRRERFEKYREVDPQNSWQPSYEHLLNPPRRVRRWRRRPRSLPVLTRQPGATGWRLRR
jgi:hypothetical protein